MPPYPTCFRVKWKRMRKASATAPAPPSAAIPASTAATSGSRREVIGAGVEAVVGAVYLDGGIDPAREAVRVLLGEALVYGLAGALLGGAVMFAFAHFVGVALDTVRQTESHLITRHYDGFAGAKGPRIRGRR